jgi:putative SOS response-associated peptidase YedK
MCGAYGFSYTDKKEVYERFAVVNDLPDLKPSWNMHPWGYHPVITAHSPNKISYMYWNLIPRISKTQDEFKRYALFNARKENLTSSRFYAKPFQTQRCLILATHFFEADRVHFRKGTKAPWHAFLLKSREPFALAGIYEIWTDPVTGKEIYSYTMVTVPPDEVVGEFHPRMPAFLQSRQDEQDWVNPDITEATRLLALLKPLPGALLEGWRVGEGAKNPRNDDPDLIKPVAETPQVKAEQLGLI